jgi:serine/threonine-protein kinase RsbW
MDCVEVRIVNRLEDISRVADMVERFGAEHSIPGPVVNDLNVALDEVLNNIVSYAYRPTEQGEIVVRLDYRTGEVQVEIEDAGPPYDPLQAPAPDLDRPLHERPIGGLGIHFIKSLMDEVAYVRLDGKNRLRLTKRLPAA